MENIAEKSSAQVAHSRVSSLLDVVHGLYELGKPKVLSLLLISTACPMVLAASGRFYFYSIMCAVIGGALVSSSASVINCIWDMDIDKIMSRTQNRPLVTGRVSPVLASIYALFIGIVGVLFLALTLNPLAAFFALAGHLFYVFVYTMWLKRSTPQNIVIGGAAGAVPPLVAWAATTGKIELQAVLMFLFVFLWTPPHFWALALNKNEDYRRANIPMLPVIYGEKVTHLQMLCYAISLLPVGLLLVLSDSNLGFLSLFVFVTTGLFFIWQNYQLFMLGKKLPSPELEEKKTKLAWQIFGFSIIYLALVFFVLVVDSAFIPHL